MAFISASLTLPFPGKAFSGSPSSLSFFRHLSTKAVWNSKIAFCLGGVVNFVGQFDSLDLEFLNVCSSFGHLGHLV